MDIILTIREMYIHSARVGVINCNLFYRDILDAKISNLRLLAGVALLAGI